MRWNRIWFTPAIWSRSLAQEKLQWGATTVAPKVTCVKRPLGPAQTSNVTCAETYSFSKHNYSFYSFKALAIFDTTSVAPSLWRRLRLATSNCRSKAATISVRCRCTFSEKPCKLVHQVSNVWNLRDIAATNRAVTDLVYIGYLKLQIAWARPRAFTLPSAHMLSLNRALVSSNHSNVSEKQ